MWRIGVLTLTTAQGRNKIHGRADVPVYAFTEKRLHVVRDDNPFERHTSVTGWPQTIDDDETKQQWKQICLELSLHPEVKLVVPELPIVLPANPEMGSPSPSQ